jgi:hypothetical protein
MPKAKSVFLPCDTGVFKVALRCDDDGGAPEKVILIKIDDPNWPENAIITDFTLDLATSQQFLHALDGRIYMFPFGDRIGDLVLTGICFNSGYCGASKLSGKESVEEPLKYYLENKLNTDEGLKPKKIVIAEQDTPFLGFLSSLKFATRADMLPIVQWVMRFYVVIDPEGVSRPPLATNPPFAPGGKSTFTPGATTPSIPPITIGFPLAPNAPEQPITNANTNTGLTPEGLLPNTPFSGPLPTTNDPQILPIPEFAFDQPVLRAPQPSTSYPPRLLDLIPR